MKRLWIKSISILIVLSLAVCYAGLVPVNAATNKKIGTAFQTVSGKNWMSAIDESKKLYQITIPGTHDSAMAHCKNSTSNFVKLMGIPLVNSGKYAQTQLLTIGEQLEAGVRFFDLRFSAKKGELRLCHGDLDDVKAVNNKLWILDFYPLFAAYELAGMPFVDLDTEFYAYEDKDCKIPSTYDTAITQIKAFLAENPSETIILKLKRENGEYEPYIAQMKEKIDALKSEINPSTKRPYLYNENGSYFYTRMPTLAETRGQIILLTPDYEAIGCGDELDMYNGTGMAKYMGMYFNFHNHWDIPGEQKTEELKRFFHDYVRDVKGGQRVLYGSVFHTSSNVVMKESPAEIEATVGKWLYADNTLQEGHFYGWFLSDFLDKEKTEKIWMTNF